MFTLLTPYLAPSFCPIAVTVRVAVSPGFGFSGSEVISIDEAATDGGAGGPGAGAPFWRKGLNVLDGAGGPGVDRGRGLGLLGGGAGDLDGDAEADGDSLGLISMHTGVGTTQSAWTISARNVIVDSARATAAPVPSAAVKARTGQS